MKEKLWELGRKGRGINDKVSLKGFPLSLRCYLILLTLDQTVLLRCLIQIHCRFFTGRKAAKARVVLYGVEQNKADCLSDANILVARYEH